MGPARLTNELGRLCQRRGWLAAARHCYAAASFLAPDWSGSIRWLCRKRSEGAPRTRE